ncbi:hypothetical protein ZIOFF_021605 [Zingiber officinale]|uniref:Brix domain-containing protein n=1 Tax=Zingiber officinale TaxID=94328 RepID=A0A8J5HC04_ZINOF|nr:hypothetical protein ZIOFF_021605 [Zingiber officinale]
MSFSGFVRNLSLCASYSSHGNGRGGGDTRCNPSSQIRLLALTLAAFPLSMPPRATRSALFTVLLVRITKFMVISEIIEFCRAHEYTDVIFVHEHRGEPDNLVICHLSFGPTTFFELLNVLCADLFCFIVNNYSLVKGLQTSLNISFLCLNLKLNE